MSFEQLSLFLDVLLLVFLGVMIFVAVRLSKGLTNFRSNRKQMGDQIAALSRSIDQANAAIINMRATTAKTSEQLKGLIEESKRMSAELEIMNEAANNTAKRLEKASSMQGGRSPRTPITGNVKAREKESAFNIQDREFDEPAAKPRAEFEDDMDMPEGLQSQAERELYRALKKRPSSGRH
jgi:hypothetical protein